MSLAVYHRTWAHSVQIHQYTSVSSWFIGRIKVDDTILNSYDELVYDKLWYSWEGEVTLNQLYPDVYHVISVYNYDHSSSDTTGYVGIAIIYSE